MRRDFSQANKSKIISLVKEVENSKISSFTDWIGDKWYVFESWIGLLNIRNFINNINSYHKKVIDKNNSSVKKIEEIFKNVSNVDIKYYVYFSDISKRLNDCDKYIKELNRTVNPSNGRFNSGYILSGFSKLIKALNTKTDKVEEVKSKEKELTKRISDTFDFFSKFFKGAAKLTGDKDISVASPIISFAKNLYGFSTSDKSGFDLVSEWFSLAKSGTSVEKAIYDFFDDHANMFEKQRLYNKFGHGKLSMGLTVGSECLGFISDVASTINVLVDDDSKSYEKVSKVFDLYGSGVHTIGKTLIATECGSKSIRYLTKASNQILQTPELTFGVSAEAKATASKIGTIVAVVDVSASTVAAGYKKWGECYEDGEIDAMDVGEIGVYGSCEGLSSVVSDLTLGIVNVDGEKMADNLIEGVNTYIERDSFLTNYVKNPDNPAVLKFIAAEGVALGVVGQEVIDTANELGINKFSISQHLSGGIIDGEAMESAYDKRADAFVNSDNLLSNIMKDSDSSKVEKKIASIGADIIVTGQAMADGAKAKIESTIEDIKAVKDVASVAVNKLGNMVSTKWQSLVNK